MGQYGSFEELIAADRETKRLANSDTAAQLAAARAENERLRGLHERIAKALALRPDRTHLELMLDADMARDFARDALATPAASTPGAGLVWSSEPPKVAGWYWTRGVDDKGRPLTVPVRFEGMAHWFAGVREWAGPIPEPREPGEEVRGE